MRYGSLWERLVRGVRWSWIDPRYQSALPPDLDASVMTLDSRDRLHAKQGARRPGSSFIPRRPPPIELPGRHSAPGRRLARSPSISSGISGSPGWPG